MMFRLLDRRRSFIWGGNGDKQGQCQDGVYVSRASSGDAGRIKSMKISALSHSFGDVLKAILTEIKAKKVNLSADPFIAFITNLFILNGCCDHLQLILSLL